MDSDIDFYLKNIVRRWKKEASNSESLIIFSPYITSKTAETVTTFAQNDACEIYTLFSSELFINQSSSITTLINLKKKGFKIYSLPNLHAKIIIVPGSFASIGSQNLTSKGATNLEALVVFNNRLYIDQIQSEASHWIYHRTEITMDMLKEMESEVRPHLKKYKIILEHASEIDEKIKENSVKRTQDYIQLQKAKKRRKEKLTALKNTLLNTKKSKEVVFGQVKFLEPSWDSYSNGRYSFIPYDHETSLLNWLVDDRAIQLARTNRYLCLIEDSGKLGWARVVKTRITFFASGVSRTETVNIGETICKIDYSSVWDDYENLDWNISFKIKPIYSDYVILITAWFGLNKLKINSISYENKFDKASYRVKVWIKENKHEFKEILREGLLDPFKYQNNLTGIEANQFFETIEEEIQIRLGTIDSMPILLAKNL